MKVITSTSLFIIVGVSAIIFSQSNFRITICSIFQINIIGASENWMPLRVSFLFYRTKLVICCLAFKWHIPPLCCNLSIDAVKNLCLLISLCDWLLRWLKRNFQEFSSPKRPVPLDMLSGCCSDKIWVDIFL